MSFPALALARRDSPGVRSRVVLIGWAIHVPDVDDGAVPAERSHELLGRKGLLYKEPATRLALCAVHRALGLPARAPRASGAPDPHTAVVASSNLGNVETVAKVARIVRETSGHDVSPLDAPNASSNVLASTVAIWFGFGGPNLMVCSGAPSGLDALRLGSLLLRSGRARRVVVVGAEPDDELSVALRRRRRAPASGPPRAGAAALLLEHALPDREGVAVMLGGVRSGRSAAELVVDGAPLVLGPSELAGACAYDAGAELGDLYGALGIAQVAVAATQISGGDASVDRATVVCGDEVDGWRAVSLARARAQRSAP